MSHNCLQGAWGSEDLTLSELPRDQLVGGIGHRITLSTGLGILVLFTPGDTVLEDKRLTPDIWKIDYTGITTRDEHAMQFYEACARARDEHSGRAYYIYYGGYRYRDDLAAPLHEGSLQLFEKALKQASIYYGIMPTDVLCARSGTVDHVRISPRQMYSECPHVLDIKTGHVITRICRKISRPSKAYNTIYMGARSKITGQLVYELSKICADDHPVYVFSMTPAGPMLQVHEQHLRALEGRFIPAAYIESYIASRYEPADEDNIRYDDDGGCDSEDY